MSLVRASAIGRTVGADDTEGPAVRILLPALLGAELYFKMSQLADGEGTSFSHAMAYRFDSRFSWNRDLEQSLCRRLAPSFLNVAPFRSSTPSFAWVALWSSGCCRAGGHTPPKRDERTKHAIG